MNFANDRIYMILYFLRACNVSIVNPVSLDHLNNKHQRQTLEVTNWNGIWKGTILHVLVFGLRKYTYLGVEGLHQQIIKYLTFLITIC